MVSSYKSANLEIGSDDFEEALGKLLEWNDAEIARSFSVIWDLSNGKRPVFLKPAIASLVLNDAS